MKEKFDKTQIIGFVLIGLILVGYLFYAQKNAEEVSKEMQVNEASASNQISKPLEVIKTIQADSLSKGEQINKEEIISIENEELDLKISSKGAIIKQARLKKWNAYDKIDNSHDKPLYLVNENNLNFNIALKAKSGQTINTKDLLFTPQVEGNKATFTSDLGNGGLIQFIYTFTDAYTLDFSIRSQGLSQTITTDPANLFWEHKAIALEKGRSQELGYTEFRYSINNYGNTDYDTNGFTEEKDKIDWISVKQQFFATILESEGVGFINSRGELEAVKENDEYLKDFKFYSNINLDKSTNELNSNLKWNFLPLSYDLLKTYKANIDGKEISKNFQYNLPFGWFKWLNVFYLWIYDWLASYGIAAGWAIFLMTIIVKIITSPIMYKQFRLSAMMRVLKPEIDEINAKFKDADPMKKQQETMALYNKARVSPFSGCLPALIQIPIFMSLFRFFPNNIAIRGKSFLWADDLTAYDSIFEWNQHIPLLSSIYGNHVSLFTLLYCAVLLIYTRMSSSNMTQPTQEGMPDMRFIMYLMPVMFIFVLNGYSSGLSWYYFVSNLINIILILLIKKWMLDEKKIHAQIQQNKAMTPKKQSKWRQKMNNIMAQAQEAQAEQQKQKNKTSGNKSKKK